MKLLKAAGRLYTYHLIMVAVSLFLVITFWGLAERSELVFSSITILIYGITVYSVGWKCGERDGRRIPGFYPSKSFPFLLAGLGAIIPVLLYVTAFAFPDLWHADIPLFNGEYEFLFAGNYLKGTPDLIYKLWYFPFISLMGNGNPFLYAFPVFAQALLIVIGYFVGTKRSRLLEKVKQKMVFVQKKEEK